ncbi:hypothetical protein T4E_664 [Trichinella pseudospiralis]|uniref:DUF5641 domain-containing protein n=1 Tax=Trichinella pseudospiralis TaxID=6337 RepID=A0A0V0XFF4_TRIPS|nr:hypothetical protein T4E_664 [Trichinella pseudospiralis]
MTKRQEPKEGDIVLVKEDNTKRENWPIGRITSVLPGSDGLSRTVEVSANNKRIRISAKKNPRREHLPGQ